MGESERVSKRGFAPLEYNFPLSSIRSGRLRE